MTTPFRFYYTTKRSHKNNKNERNIECKVPSADNTHIKSTPSDNLGKICNLIGEEGCVGKINNIHRAHMGSL